MADETQEPRRYKLPSEYSDAERELKGRLGRGEDRLERNEYVRWRERMLRDERDDLGLRQRLLREQAAVLRLRAGDVVRDAREAMTPEDHADHLAAIRAAREEGFDPPDLVDGDGSKLDRQADELEGEADEIQMHLAEEAAA